MGELGCGTSVDRRGCGLAVWACFERLLDSALWEGCRKGQGRREVLIRVPGAEAAVLRVVERAVRNCLLPNHVNVGTVSRVVSLYAVGSAFLYSTVQSGRRIPGCAVTMKQRGYGAGYVLLKLNTAVDFSERAPVIC